MTPDISAPFFASSGATVANGPVPHSSKGVVTGNADSERILVIGSMAAAQTGQYQQAVQQASQDGARQVEMHMADRLTDGGEFGVIIADDVSVADHVHFITKQPRL